MEVIGGLKYICKSYKISVCGEIILRDTVLSSFAQNNWC